MRVNAGQVGDRVLINVVDEGPGIPRGTEEQLFEPFQRLGDHDNTTGVGLGLSVARGFVEAMGGTIAATDTPGGGLTVDGRPGRAARSRRDDQDPGAGDRRRTADPAGAADQPVRARLRGDHRGDRRRRRCAPPPSTGPTWSSSTSACPTCPASRCSTGCAAG